MRLCDCDFATCQLLVYITRHDLLAAMAIARPVRVLGLAAIMMWCFFLYQVFKPGGSIKTPLGIPNNERDPLLDRELSPTHPP